MATIPRIDARTYTGQQAARGECPRCEETGGLHWRGVLVPEAWDRVFCHHCKTTVAIDCLVAEHFPTCHGGCGKPGLIASPIPDPEIDEDTGYCPPSCLFGLGESWTCGDPHCRIEAIKLARESAQDRADMLSGRLY